MADPSGPSREIAVEVDLDDVPAPAAPPPRPRVPNAALALAAVVIALAAGVVVAVKLLPPGETTAEAVVREYLEAVLDRDVEAAMAMTVRSELEDEFLAPEVLDTRWSVVAIDQIDHQEMAEGHTRSGVRVEVEAFDGTRASARFEVVHRDGEARIANALSDGNYYLSEFDFLELNGVTGERPGPQTRLLPGLYTSYESMPDTLNLHATTTLLLGDQYVSLSGDDASQEPAPMPFPAPSEAGMEVVAERVEEHLSACASDPGRDGCALAFPPDPAPSVALADGAAWEIAAYPTVAVEQYSYSVSDSRLVFELVTAEPGEARVEAVVTDDAGTRETTLGCAIWMEGWAAAFALDGTVNLTPRSDADEACRSVVEVR